MLVTDKLYKKLESTCTERQIEVIVGILEGKSNKQIADELFIEEKTIKYHNTNIYRMLNVKNKAQAVFKLLDIAGIDYKNQKRRQQNDKSSNARV